MSALQEASAENITMERARELARHEDPHVRLEVAKRSDLEPELLYFLSDDTDISVRVSVAENGSAPFQTDLLLAHDDDAEVRQSLANKIAVNRPPRPDGTQGELHKSTKAALKFLAQDQLTAVRQVLSDALKDVPDAPIEVIKMLALDDVLNVAAPVLQYSPVLSDEDLISIIEQGPTDGAIGFISQREQVGERLSDAIVETDDKAAIGLLLGNKSAQIREETLDNLVAKASDIELWHSPLAARPKISPRTATKMALFLANDLLKELMERSDLDEETIKAVKMSVQDRIQHGGVKIEPETSIDDSNQDFINTKLPIDKVSKMHRTNKIDDFKINNALKNRDFVFVFTVIGVRSGVDFNICRKIFNEKNNQAVVALCWKAGLPVETCERVQQRMARISPSNLIEGTSTNEYAMSEDEMDWQIEFYSVVS